MCPTRAKIKYADQSMGLFEEFVSGHSNGPAGAENVQKGNHDLSNDTPYNVLLLDECGISLRLRLVESPFYKRPNQSMQERLNENYATGPAMQEIKVLVRDAGDER